MSVEAYRGHDGYAWIRVSTSTDTRWIRSRHRGNAGGIFCDDYSASTKGPQQCMLIKRPPDSKVAMELQLFRVTASTLSPIPGQAGILVVNAEELSSDDLDRDGHQDVTFLHKGTTGAQRRYLSTWRNAGAHFVRTGCATVGDTDTADFRWTVYQLQTDPCPG
jgi:hypothetical protein